MPLGRSKADVEQQGAPQCGRRLDEDQRKRRCARTGPDSVTGFWKRISKQRRRVDVAMTRVW